MMRHNLKRFSMGNDPKKGMGIGLQEIVEKWLADHKIPYNLEDFTDGKDENDNTTIEVIVEKNPTSHGNKPIEVKMIFTF